MTGVIVENFEKKKKKKTLKGTRIMAGCNFMPCTSNAQKKGLIPVQLGAVQGLHVFTLSRPVQCIADVFTILPMRSTDKQRWRFLRLSRILTRMYTPNLDFRKENGTKALQFTCG